MAEPSSSVRRRCKMREKVFGVSSSESLRVMMDLLPVVDDDGAIGDGRDRALLDGGGVQFSDATKKRGYKNEIKL